MSNSTSGQPRRSISRLGLDFFIGIAILLGAAGTGLGHFRSAYDFVIESRMTQCEAPLNNRCDYVYCVREASGEERVTDLGAFRPDLPDLAIGNSILKRRNSFAYFVNGREVEWPEASLFTGAVLLALVLLGSAVYRTRCRN
jgi:hypothetical protein